MFLVSLGIFPFFPVEELSPERSPLILISAEKTKDLGLAYDDSLFLDKDFAVHLFSKSQIKLFHITLPTSAYHNTTHYEPIAQCQAVDI